MFSGLQVRVKVERVHWGVCRALSDGAGALRDGMAAVARRARVVRVYIFVVGGLVDLAGV